MKQYTTEWAKKYLNLTKNDYIYQKRNGMVYSGNYRIKWIASNMSCCQRGWGKRYKIGKMLEHPDGWQKSLVTREML